MVQLELDLFPGVPWGGRSPRALTSGRLALIFEARAAEERPLFCDRDQLGFWPAGQKRQRRPSVVSRGAPTLIPLPRRV